MSQAKKENQLGMKFGTACNELRKKILFKLVKETNQNFCFRCDEEILSAQDLSIDHKIDWLDENAELFWDLDNIAFSHKVCNKKRESKSKKHIINGEGWCAQHKKYLPISNFYKDSSRWNGINWRCKDCQRIARKKY